MQFKNFSLELRDSSELRPLTALLEDPGSVPGTHTVVCNLSLTAVHERVMQVVHMYIQAKTHTQKVKINI